jgi:predicted RNA-binding Zn-ribbon protein involved in translation (DUF1610 family)
MASPLSRRNVIHSAYVADSRSMSGDSAGALAVEISILPAASVRDVSEIPCPNCDAALGRVDEAFRLFMFPHIACPCGFSGPFNWVNPRLGISVEEAISRLESRRNSSHIADTALHSESPASTGHKAPL